VRNLATVRIEKSSDFTVLSNTFLDDTRLSLKAIGLLSYMLRLPDDWNFTIEWLSGKHKDGLASIRTAILELEAAGYVTRSEQIRTDGGTFRGADYIVRETPEGGVPTACENRTRSACENRTRSACENRTRSLIDKPNTEEPSTNTPQAPQGGRRRKREKPECDYEPEAFERFWRLYPRGEDKAAARYEWDELRPDPALMRTMSAALKRQMKTDEWQRGIGIPYACRWLSKRRWEAAEKLPEAPAPAGRTDPAEEVGERW